MGDDRRDRYRNPDEFSRREDDGYIARRGFGNRSAGYERNRSGRDEGGSHRGGGADDRSGFERGGSYRRDDDGRSGGRERDFGDSAGYGTGGSARDWRDVMGDDRGGGYSAPGGSSRGRDDESRFGAGDFGRGSRGDDEERGFLERAGDEIRSWFGDDDHRGQHRGRGPKNYQRSDERIREDVNDRLTDDPHIDASEIDVSVQNREVTLTGSVTTRFEKRHAEDLAERVSGVTHVQNNLRVGQAGLSAAGGAFAAGSQEPAGGMPGSGSAASGGAEEASQEGSGRIGSRRRTPTA